MASRILKYLKIQFPSCIFMPKVQENIEINRVKANLPLQIAAYFNATFIPIWMIILIIFLFNNYKSFGNLVQVLIVIIISSVFIIEIIRIYMLYEGNLKDKIPELAGFWMLSVFLQFPLQSALLFNSYFKFRVLEIICQSVIFILLIIQIFFGYFALKFNVSEQAKLFKEKGDKIRQRFRNNTVESVL